MIVRQKIPFQPSKPSQVLRQQSQHPSSISLAINKSVPLHTERTSMCLRTQSFVVPTPRDSAVELEELQEESHMANHVVHESEYLYLNEARTVTCDQCMQKWNKRETIICRDCVFFAIMLLPPLKQDSHVAKINHAIEAKPKVEWPVYPPSLHLTHTLEFHLHFILLMLFELLC